MATAEPGSRFEADLVGLAGENVLVLFHSADPAEAKSVPVEGVEGTLLGIDTRPEDGHLYGVSDASNVYEIDPSTGAARLVSTLTVPFDADRRSAVDFNPQSDRLRLIGRGGQNLRAHADLGATAIDAALAYASGDPHFGEKPLVVAAAYTNALEGTPVTKLFDLDAALDVLVLQEPPNDGLLTTVGKLGADFGDATGFDIVTVAGEDHAFAVSSSKLFTIDLSTGLATERGPVGSPGWELIGLAILPATPRGASASAEARLP